MDITEVSEELDKLDVALLDLEKSVSENSLNKDIIHIIFRYAHNLKGMLSFIGKEYSANLIHEIESNFELIRKGNKIITYEMVEKYLSAIDIVKNNLLDEENILISECSK
jgi:two-component system chemotaxis sensor kinase CheA